MLNEGQIKYLETMLEAKKAVIKPFNPKGLEVAYKIIAQIKAVEPDLKVMLLGSLPLKISGQEDIDISVFCERSKWPNHLDNLKKLFGEPNRNTQSAVKWEFKREEFGVGVLLADPNSQVTKDQVKLFIYLKIIQSFCANMSKLKRVLRVYHIKNTKKVNTSFLIKF